MLTRRETTKIVLAGAALPFLPTPALAKSSDAWAQQLQGELNAHLISGCNGKLTLRKFGTGHLKGQTRMVGVIQLDWPPGFRRRKFDAFGPKDDAVFNQLLNQALFSFAKAWPGCVV